MHKTTTSGLACPSRFRPNGDWGPCIEEDGIPIPVSAPAPGAEYFERSDAWDRFYLLDLDGEDAFDILTDLTRWRSIQLH